jgi:hypothetical protein
MRAVARLTPRGASIRLNGHKVGETAANLASTRTAPRRNSPERPRTACESATVMGPRTAPLGDSV